MKAEGRFIRSLRERIALAPKDAQVARKRALSTLRHKGVGLPDTAEIREAETT